MRTHADRREAGSVDEAAGNYYITQKEPATESSLTMRVKQYADATSKALDASKSQTK